MKWEESGVCISLVSMDNSIHCGDKVEHMFEVRFYLTVVVVSYGCKLFVVTVAVEV